MTLAAQLEQARVLAILRRPDIGTQVLTLVKHLYNAGVRAVEITQDQPDSLAAVEELTAAAPPDLIVGAGTVMTTDQLDAVMMAGAQFAVCPHLDLQLVDHGAARGLPVIPGVTTATEVVTARTSGVQVLKLFPAGPLGPNYLKTLRGPFPHVAFLPTGGIQVDSIPAWIEAGALCVGVGSGLFGPNGVHPRLAALLDRG
ncbi:MAG: bifunctional 4-hydroxy-2-oxoglutarate aldolase/2-dehydro-3-deoxy-phosphogluconate aldolase [Haloechinothrix sp.]